MANCCQNVRGNKTNKRPTVQRLKTRKGGGLLLGCSENPILILMRVSLPPKLRKTKQPSVAGVNDGKDLESHLTDDKLGSRQPGGMNERL